MIISFIFTLFSVDLLSNLPVSIPLAVHRVGDIISQKVVGSLFEIIS